MGTQFDLENGEFALTKEGAHSQRRILHAHGDATGAEIVRALSENDEARSEYRDLGRSFCDRSDHARRMNATVHSCRSRTDSGYLSRQCNDSLLRWCGTAVPIYHESGHCHR